MLQYPSHPFIDFFLKDYFFIIIKKLISKNDWSDTKLQVAVCGTFWLK